ncbi:hypothetical protein [Massilia sp. Root335]|uniref:hypothetical protein n=1 Tax=Massilia sp. Root335 TaxID=1736517 RepID=UPI0012F67EF7|nr:hypothetical protein [Massilia sp. Root335]
MPSHAQKKSPFGAFVKGRSQSVKPRLTPVFIGEGSKKLTWLVVKAMLKPTELTRSAFLLHKRKTMSKKTKKVPLAKRGVELPAGLRARVNQLAARRGKEEAELVRVTCLQALQAMANEGLPVDQIAEAFKAIEADGGRYFSSPVSTQ